VPSIAFAEILLNANPRIVVRNKTPTIDSTPPIIDATEFALGEIPLNPVPVRIPALKLHADIA
jgi:hypothetical protein